MSRRILTIVVAAAAALIVTGCASRTQLTRSSAAPAGDDTLVASPSKGAGDRLGTQQFARTATPRPAELTAVLPASPQP